MTHNAKNYVLVFIISGLLWFGVFLAIAIPSGAASVTVRDMIGDARYWPPKCNSNPCVLTGLGGIVGVWENHVDTNLALGRSFVVKGLCASACEIAAIRADAKLLPGAKLVSHSSTRTVWE